MKKETLKSICKLAFEMGQLYQKRRDIFIKDDIGECIAYSKNCGGQVQHYAKEENNIAYIIEGLQKIKYEFNKQGYTKEQIQDLLNGPWEDIEKIINAICEN